MFPRIHLRVSSKIAFASQILLQHLLREFFQDFFRVFSRRSLWDSSRSAVLDSFRSSVVRAEISSAILLRVIYRISPGIHFENPADVPQGEKGWGSAVFGNGLGSNFSGLFQEFCLLFLLRFR